MDILWLFIQFVAACFGVVLVFDGIVDVLHAREMQRLQDQIDEHAAEREGFLQVEEETLRELIKQVEESNGS